MPNHTAYEQLHQEDQTGNMVVTLNPVATSIDEASSSQNQSCHEQGSPGIAPPAYDDLMSTVPMKMGFAAPPAYEVATMLPSYDQVQRDKVLEEQRRDDGPPGPRPARSSAITMLSVEEEDLVRSDTDLVLGTDFLFFVSFIVAFLFNWIGFLLLICFCHTVAGRYGALAGFGLSLTKWIIIVKHSTDLISSDNRWLWYLVMAFGLTICMRAIVQYQCVKREWHRLSRAAQERVILFY